MNKWSKLSFLILLLHVPVLKGQNTNDLNLENDVKKEQTIQAEIVVGDQKFGAVFFDNPSTQSLLDQMPFTIELKDYARTEMIFYPKKALSQDNAPDGAKPVAGDIMCYGPWGNVAIFYKDAPYASGLIPIGRIEDVEPLVKALASNRHTATFVKD